jgi:hypothetical protein
MATKVKTSFTATLYGKKLQFTNITLKTYGTVYRGGQQIHYYYSTMLGVSQAIRQYMKQAFPDVEFRIKTESYSLGDSVRVNLLSNVGQVKYNQIRKELESVFEKGSFNGMEDIYEYNGGGLKVEYAGQTVDIGTKYLFVEQPR